MFTSISLIRPHNIKKQKQRTTDLLQSSLSLLWNVAPEMQLRLLSHAHQMEEACSSFRSWPIFLYFKDFDLFPYFLRYIRWTVLCKQWNWFRQNSKFTDGFYIMSIHYWLLLFGKLSRFNALSEKKTLFLIHGKMAGW